MRAHSVGSVLVASLGLLGAACVVSKSPLGEPTPQGDDTSTGSGTSSATGQASMSSTSVDPSDETSDVVRLDVHPGNTGSPPDDETSNADEGIALDVWAGSCAAAGVHACFDDVIAACAGEGNWDVDEACIETVQACYPIALYPVAPADVVDACSAEIAGECITTNAPGCASAFCECTRGLYPFDPSDCWDVLLLACAPGAQSDCQDAIDHCFPGTGTTPANYAACRADIISAHPQCNCPSCDMHEVCAEALADCLGT